MHSRRFSLFVTALFLTTFFVGVDAQQNPDIEPLNECDLEVHTATEGALVDAEDQIEITVRNPIGKRTCAIWQFMFVVPQSEGIDWQVGEDKTSIHGVDAPEAWKIETTSRCSGTENLQPASFVTTANTCDTLVFTAPKKLEVRPGGVVEFKISLIVDAARNYCEKIFIGVAGVHIDKDNAGKFTHTELEATKTNTPRGFLLVFDDHVEAQTLPEFSYMWDDDHNGHVDHVYVQFDKELDPLTVHVGDWNVGIKRPGFDPYPVLKANVVDPVVAPQDGNYCPVNSAMVIKFDEEDLFDTGGDEDGNMPEVSYRMRPGGNRLDPRGADVLSILAGDRVPTQDAFAPADHAKPVLMSAIIQLDEEDPEFNYRVLLTWSEPVGMAGPMCEDGFEALTAANFHLALDSVTDPVLLSDYGRVYPAIEAGDIHMWIEMWEANATDTTPPDHIEESELEYRFEPDGTSNTIEPNAKPHRLRPGHDVCDRDGNRAWQHGDHGLMGPTREPTPLGGTNPGTDTSAPCPLPGSDLQTGGSAESDACIEDWLAFAEPSIISVDGNIGFNKVTVRFNVPINITAEYEQEPWRLFTVVEGQGPSGVTNMSYTRGADKIILTLDGNLKANDTSGQPSYLRMRGGQVAAAWSELNNGTDHGTPWFMVTQDQRVVDVTAPNIMYALTRDLDSNGVVDAVQIIASEPLRDVSFSGGNRGEPDVTVDIQDHTNYRRIDLGATNDRILYIGMEPQNLLSGYGTHRIPEFTIERKSVNGELQGFVMDMAQDPNADQLGVASGNWMENLTAADLRELDGAPPVVLDAFTIDRDENGLLDGYVVVFSEPVNDTSFEKEHWTVKSKADGHFYAVNGLLPLNSIDSLNEWDYFANDHILVLNFTERPYDPQRPKGDTGNPPPELTYFVAPGEDAGITDLAELPRCGDPDCLIFLGGPNRMAKFDESKVNERDESRPVLMAAIGCEGQDFLRLVFSEPVGVKEKGQPVRAIKEQDLFYENVNPAGNDSQGRSFASGFKTDSVLHSPGDDRLTVLLEGFLNRTDLGNDRVRIVADVLQDEEVSVVREIGGPLQTEHEAPTLSEADDIWEPEQVVPSIQEDPDSGAERITAATVQLEWEIPHDRGCVDAGVTDYVFAIQDMDNNRTPLTETTFSKVQNPPNLIAEYWWYDAKRERNETGTPLQLLRQHGVDEGKILQVRVAGLNPDTNYQLAMKAADEAGNTGPMSQVLEFKTKIDLTPPIKPAGWELRSETHLRGVPGKDPNPKFDWDPAIDNETIYPWYIWDITKSPDHQPDPQVQGIKRLKSSQARNITFTPQIVAELAPKAPLGLAPENWFDEAGKWYFHLSACSGGGCTLLDSFELRIDSKVNRTEMLDANRRIESNVIYDAESKSIEVTWTMPPESETPCPAAGAQIWRRGQGQAQYQLLGTFGENDAIYKDGLFIDSSQNASKQAKYLVTMICPERVATYYNPQIGMFEGTILAGAGRFPDTHTPPTEDYEGQSAAVRDAPFPWVWVWVILGILALLAATAYVLFFVLRGRGDEERWEEAELEEQDGSSFDGADAGPDASTDAEPDEPEH